MRPMTLAGVVLLAALSCLIDSRVKAADPWLVFDGFDGPGKGKHIVLITGDEEYRSEEALPQLAKILARHHGFKCTVLFAIDRKNATARMGRLIRISGTTFPGWKLSRKPT